MLNDLSAHQERLLKEVVLSEGRLVITRPKISDIDYLNYLSMQNDGLVKVEYQTDPSGAGIAIILVDKSSLQELKRYFQVDYTRDGHSWIGTYMGHEVYPFAPIEADIDVLDIAHALSMKVRFTGHTKFLYPVGQHSLLMSDYLWKQTRDPMLAYWALHHDDTEAYLPDVASPLKSQLTGFKELEDKLMGVIARVLHLPYPKPPIIKEYDIRILLNEKRDVMNPTPTKWEFEENYKPLPDLFIEEMGVWQYVRTEWLAQHYMLQEMLDGEPT